MKESDYVKATNLAKAMAALAILRDINVDTTDPKQAKIFNAYGKAAGRVAELVDCIREKIRIAGDK